MPTQTDTIAAIATPSGAGGVAVVRVSGSAAPDIARAILGKLPQPREATLARFRDAQGETVDFGLALYFPAPNSFTGEHVLELQGHGGVVVADLVLQATLARGARLARPGEFSERAFLNDKLDLAEAEAVADLIDAGSARAARSALRSLSGAFSERVHALVEQLIRLRMYVEAAIDFPEEEVDFLGDGRISSDLASISKELAEVRTFADQGRILRDGINVVIVGAPNSGKSSLLNRLAGYDAAIVTDIPGTTRDVLRERISLKGVPIHLVDTAGLRESDDPVEAEGIRRTRREMVSADHLLIVYDDSEPQDSHLDLFKDLEQAFNGLITHVFNKVDKSGRKPGIFRSDVGLNIAISAKTGAGIDHLVTHMVESAGFHQESHGLFSARRRHIEALDRCAEALARGERVFVESAAGELLALELSTAQQALGEITGEFTPDDLLGRIFSSFCIGK